MTSRDPEDAPRGDGHPAPGSGPAGAPPRGEPPAPEGRSADATGDVFAEIHRRGDRWMAWFVGFHTLLALALAPVHDTWRPTLVVTAAAAGAYLLAMWRRPGRPVTRAVAGLSLQAFVALHIHQMRGLAEMHFFFFTATTALVIYQDWRAIWPGVAAIIAQHTLFSYWHNAGVSPGGHPFFEPRHVGLVKIGFHYGIALAQAVVASYWSEVLRRRTLASRAAEEEAARHLADAQRAQRRAEAASVARTQFLANMSHELRTPLNAIGGHVQLVAMGVHGPVTAEQGAALERVERAQRHLLGIINDLLNFAKLDAGAVHYDVQPTLVADVLRHVASLIQPQFAAKGHTLEVHVPEGAGAAPVLVWADREKLAQILLNLLSNAAKFTPAGGRIVLALAPSAPRPVPGGGGRDGADEAGEAEDTVGLAVSDTGIGIAPEKLEGIFDPFVQVNASLTRPHEGTGLGLAISRDLARGMGGTLTVRSTEGEGSTFVVALRRAPADALGSQERLPAGDRRAGAERRTSARRLSEA